MRLIGFDVGGTFIDLFAYDSTTGQISVHKTDSARGRLGEAIADGIAELVARASIEPSEVERVAHGTTVVTNQLVQRAGACVGVICTRGFRDVIEIGRMRRRSLTDLGQSQSHALAPRTMRVEIDERTEPDGQVATAIDPTQVREALELLVERGAESIAVCLINSYANPANEESAAALCAELGVECSLSSHVSPEFGEYERWSTATLNSYVMPQTRAYLDDVSRRLIRAGITAPLEVMQSSGGVLPAPAAACYPVRLIESGPGAGVAAAAQIAKRTGRRRIITLDVGGTSADVSVVIDGQPRFISEHDIEQLPIRTIGIDVRSIGAGGGSVAWLDRMGGLQVGPHSAGADPGPACYGGGGTAPTVTDADLIAGYLDPLKFCAGARRLDVGRARVALATLAEPLGRTCEQVALGIIHVAVTRMTGAIRTITTQAGHDPRDCTLVAFGGAGPLHAAMVARELGIPELLIPAEPALLSARGLLLADYRADAYRTLSANLAGVDPQLVSRTLTELDADARNQLGQAVIAEGALETVYTLELCYEGQQDLVPVALAHVPFQEQDKAAVADALDTEFRCRYGFLPPGRVPRLARLRVTATGALPRPPLGFDPTDAGASRPRELRPILIGDAGKPVDATIHERTRLATDVTVAGPCVIDEGYSATLVLPGQLAAVDELGNLRVTESGA